MAKYSIEIAGPQNEYVLFVPTKDRLRGRWDWSNVTHRDTSEELKEIARVTRSGIPGRVVSLDTSAKRGSIVDPLKETAEGRKMLEAMNSVYRRYSASSGGEKAANETQVFEDLDQDNIKEWLFYMRSLVDQGYARHVPGSTELPDLQTIRRSIPGKRRKDPLANSREDTGEVKFVDEVTDAKAVKA